jgi:hypothetical protein
VHNGSIALITLASLSNPADANWFLGATAEVSATFVAIIGGFLVSRAVSAATERRTLRVQRGALDVQTAVLRSEREALDEQLFHDDWVPWLGQIAFGIAATRGNCSVEDALRSEPSERTADELRPVFEEAKRVVLTALDSFEGAFEPDEPPPPDLEEMIDLDDLDDLHRLAYWGAYMFLNNELAKKPSKFLIIPFSQPDAPEEDLEIVLDNRRVRREKEDRVSELRTNERMLTEEARLLEAEVSKAPVVAGRTAAASLIYLALGGVVWPLWLMSRMRVGLSDSAAWLTFGLVVTGLVAVVGYVVWSIGHEG